MTAAETKRRMHALIGAAEREERIRRRAVLGEMIAHRIVRSNEQVEAAVDVASGMVRSRCFDAYRLTPEAALLDAGAEVAWLIDAWARDGFASWLHDVESAARAKEGVA